MTRSRSVVCTVSGSGPIRHSRTWEGPLKGKKRGIRQGAPFGGWGWCQRGTPQLLKITPDDLTHGQTLHITMSQQAEWSAVRRRENGLRGQKPSQIILDGKYAGDLSLTHTHTKPQTNPHTLSPGTFLAEVIINTSRPQLTLPLL